MPNLTLLCIPSPPEKLQGSKNFVLFLCATTRVRHIDCRDRRETAIQCPTSHCCAFHRHWRGCKAQRIFFFFGTSDSRDRRETAIQCPTSHCCVFHRHQRSCEAQRIYVLFLCATTRVRHIDCRDRRETAIQCPTSHCCAFHRHWRGCKAQRILFFFLAHLTRETAGRLRSNAQPHIAVYSIATREAARLTGFLFFFFLFLCATTCVGHI